MIITIDLEFQKNACTIAAYIIESGQGPVLIETGPHSCFEALKEGIEAAGYKLEDIKHVLLTHIHLDHAGAAWAFAQNEATIYVHPFGVDHLADPSKLMESAKRIYQDKMDTLWGEMKAIPKKQLQSVAHEEVVQIGNLKFTAWHTPGHANHHIAWEMGGIIFTGDVAGVQIGEGPVVAPLPPPDINIEVWKESIELLRSRKAKAFYLTHYGAVTQVDAHLDALTTNIDTLAAWVKEHLDAGESIEEMTPKFDELALEELKKREMSEVEIAQYQAANPAWMSVTGLVRYWTKKAEGKL